SKRVIWNLVEASSVNISGIGIKGTFMAPNATVSFSNGHIDGSIVGGSISGGGESHNFAFVGEVRNCTALCAEVITRTWTATDACGNESTCVQTITVEDSEAPEISCPADVTLSCDESTEPSNTGTATGSDNCSGVTVDYSDESTKNLDGIVGTCDDYEYVITRTWTATDECGNSSTCVQMITVEDNEGPEISCPTTLTLECGSDTDPASIGFATATDNCSDVTVSHSDVSTQNADGVAGTCDDYEYVITRTWTAVDACGNSSSCVQTLTIEDTETPEIQCPGNVTLECGSETDPSNTGFATATDNCSGVTVTYSDVSTQDADGVAGTCDDYEYVITRTWTAVDACGNGSTCVQILTIEDNEVPEISCPDDLSLPYGSNVDPSETGYATATDN